MRKFLVTLLLAILLSRTPMVVPHAREGGSLAPEAVYFDDTHPDLLRLGADGYEIGFRKTNGAIAYLRDKTTGKDVSLGSRFECLWGSVFQVGSGVEYVGGCSYHRDEANSFSYAWSAADRTLTLSYAPDPSGSQKVPVTVWVHASDWPWVDLQLQVTNQYGYRLDTVLFPSDLVFQQVHLQRVLLPILPGIVLGPGFFTSGRDTIVQYPGYPGVFADFMALESTQGKLAIYSRYGHAPLQPGWLGYVHDTEQPPYIPESVYYIHNFAVRLANGETWRSPWVRLHIGEGFEASAAAYRQGNGLADYASLPQKLGAAYQQVAGAALYRAVANELRLPFKDYAASLLSRVPVAGLLHPVAYQPGGHDESQPDYLPPDPLWGTQADLIGMVQSAQALGFLVMPYTNPTWWDDEAPTLASLPGGLTIEDLAALDAQGNPLYETYTHGSPPHPHGGYVMSAYPAFVQSRLAQVVQDMAVTVPSDMLFEDQIGARPWVDDYNPASPSISAYIAGWLEHTRTYQDKLLHTELAFDRLAETEIGFHGSVLLPEVSGYTDTWWGDGNWSVYPLATMLVRDKVFFYQHDLATETFTKNKAILAWNLAMGYLLSYDLDQNTGMGPDNPWIKVVGVFQKQALATYAYEQVRDYRYLAPQVTQTDFDNCTVITNWSATAPYTSGGHTLPAQGAYLSCGWLTAGVFSAYNGAALSSGDHYLVEQRRPDRLTVWQPMGNETSLTLRMPASWQPGEALQGAAYTLSGQLLGSVPLDITTTKISFTYPVLVGGQAVGYVEITNPRQWVYLAMVSR